jgi:uncharacterized protein YyaL (SSP411 family)
MCGKAVHSGGNKSDSYLYSMPNRLVSEQSPYLLQHANNPVDWYPWGNEAFDKAKREHKPVIVSIGYAACHWCHVMEHESFEDEETAAYMNEHFVCIKVDREEHPDVDHMYMDAVQAIGGSGGWPLNVFVTPDRAPFYGGTYYPPRPAYNRPSWMQLLQRINELWHGQQDEITQQATQMIAHLQQASKRFFTTTNVQPDKDAPRKIADALLQMADKEKGGFGNAPKFPGTMAISYLLEHYHFTKYELALQQALRSLDAMIEGGIYDQLGGGFARYATDGDWLIPHFEKMLYDNALLVISLCDAYAITKSDRYKKIIEETIAFVERELKDTSGGYYCALDADSEGEEGKFYTWVWDEWIEALQENDVIAEEYFGVRREGNWEGTNILHVKKSITQIAEEKGITEDEVKQRIDAAKKKLWAKRATRIRPLTDDKCLLSWNALMNIALSKASITLQDERYSRMASGHMNWMLEQYEHDDMLMHTWKNGVAKIPGKLDDHAYLVQALLQLASATGDNSRIVKAVAFTEKVVEDFSAENGFFYYTPEGQSDMPVRKVDLYDGATPSANAVMAHNLWICGMCMEKRDWIEQSGEMIAKMYGTAIRYSYSFGYWAQLVQRQEKGMQTIVCSGKEAKKHLKALHEANIPQAYTIALNNGLYDVPLLENKFFADKLYIFVCSEQACLSPVNSVKEALELANT